MRMRASGDIAILPLILSGDTLLRANEVPVVNVKVMPTDNYPGGIGEVGLPPIAPAVANAIARLNGGKRLRSLPFPERVA